MGLLSIEARGVGKARSGVNASNFMAGGAASWAAGLNALLRNPTGSGKTVFVEKLVLVNPAGAAGLFLLRRGFTADLNGSWALGTTGGMGNKKLGGAASVCTFSYNDVSTVLGTATIGAYPAESTGVIDLSANPIVIPPGDGLCIAYPAAGFSGASFEWFEE